MLAVSVLCVHGCVNKITVLFMVIPTSEMYTYSPIYPDPYAPPPPLPPVQAPPAVQYISRWAQGCTGPYNVGWDAMFMISDVLW